MTLDIRFYRLIGSLVALVLLAGCSQVRVTDYADYSPEFNAEDFFSGQLVAYGVIKNRGGKVIRTLQADIEASWENGTGTLDEDFLFNDGEKQRRVWVLQPVGHGDYSGTAGDVVGKATLSSAGNSVFLDYTLRVPYGDGSIDVHVDDRMYLLSESVLLNESVMSKLGVRVGSILLVILRTGKSA